MDLREKLERARAAKYQADRSSTGPWASARGHQERFYISAPGGRVYYCTREEDAAFIAAARADVPALAADVEELVAEVERLRAIINANPLRRLTPDDLWTVDAKLTPGLNGVPPFNEASSYLRSRYEARTAALNERLGVVKASKGGP